MPPQGLIRGRASTPFLLADIAQRDAWLRLTTAKGLSRRDLVTVLREHGSPEAAWLAIRNSPKVQWVDVSNADANRFDAFLAAGGAVICLGDADYPALLADIADPPAALYVRGDPTVLWRAQVAIVGSRQGSRSGTQLAREFARAFAQTGLVVTSGLALGVDAAAHQGAIDVQAATIAVMATGVDRVYPTRHQGLAAEILAAGGALVSEMSLATAPRPELFPQRNRIIAGLSLGTLVLEAGINSGSLITARMAAEQGREVFAVPGSIHDPMARGCHQVIREGGRLVETAAEVIAGLAPMASTLRDALEERLREGDSPENQPTLLPPGLSPVARRLVSELDAHPTAIDDLVDALKLGSAQVSAALVELELAELIEALPGARFRRNR